MDWRSDVPASLPAKRNAYRVPSVAPKPLRMLTEYQLPPASDSSAVPVSAVLPEVSSEIVPINYPQIDLENRLDKPQREDFEMHVSSRRRHSSGTPFSFRHLFEQARHYYFPEQGKAASDPSAGSELPRRRPAWKHILATSWIVGLASVFAVEAHAYLTRQLPVQQTFVQETLSENQGLNDRLEAWETRFKSWEERAKASEVLREKHEELLHLTVK